MKIKEIDLDELERVEFIKIIDIMIKYYEIMWDKFEEDYREYKNDEKRDTKI